MHEYPNVVKTNSISYQLGTRDNYAYNKLKNIRDLNDSPSDKLSKKRFAHNQRMKEVIKASTHSPTKKSTIRKNEYIPKVHPQIAQL
jgi:hypothetical protein